MIRETFQRTEILQYGAKNILDFWPQNSQIIVKAHVAKNVGTFPHCTRLSPISCFSDHDSHNLNHNKKCISIISINFTIMMLRGWSVIGRQPSSKAMITILTRMTTTMIPMILTMMMMKLQRSWLILGQLATWLLGGISVTLVRTHCLT